MSTLPGIGSLQRALAAIGSRPLAWCGAVFAAALAWAVLLLAAIAAVGLAPLIEHGGLPAQASVVISMSASAAEAEGLRARLSRPEGVAKLSFVSRDAALAQLVARSPADREAIAQLAANPLPDTFVVTFRADASAEDIEEAVRSMRKLPHVDSVLLDLSWYRKLRAAWSLAQLASRSLLALFALNALAWLPVAVGIGVRIDAAEVRLLQLLGADDRLVRRPSVIAGSMTALLVGVLALGAARLAWVRLDAMASALASSYGADSPLHWPDPSWPALFLLGLGLAGALIASIEARLRLRSIAADAGR